VKSKKKQEEIIVAVQCDDGNTAFSFPSRTKARGFIRDCNKRGVSWMVTPPEVADGLTKK